MSTHSPASAGPAPAPSIEEMEAALVARRERLAVDMEVLGTRLAPEALKTQAKDTARTTAAWARTTARTVADRAKDSVRSAVDRAGAAACDAAADAGRSVKSVIAGLRPGSEEPSPAQRLARLLDDARDGDPSSLAIVTGAAMTLTGLSAVALVKAVRS